MTIPGMTCVRLGIVRHTVVDPSVGQSRPVTVPFWKVPTAFGTWSATDFNPDMPMCCQT